MICPSGNGSPQYAINCVGLSMSITESARALVLLFIKPSVRGQQWSRPAVGLCRDDPEKSSISGDRGDFLAVKIRVQVYLLWNLPL